MPRRVKSPHPGVVVLRELSRDVVRYRLRYTDPDTGRQRRETCKEQGSGRGADAARKLEAVALAERVAERRQELETARRALQPGGKLTQWPLVEATEHYCTARSATLRPKTLGMMRASLKLIAEWVAAGLAPETVRLLDGPALARLNDWLATRAAALGNARATTKKHLVAVKTWANWVRMRGHAPLLTRDAIADSLRADYTPREKAAHLNARSIRHLLEAARAHDAASQHARRLTLAPWVALLALTGMRYGEAAQLRWADVMLDDGPPRIEIRAATTKGRNWRQVWLDVSPGLVALLQAMRGVAPRDEYVIGGVGPVQAKRAVNWPGRLRAWATQNDMPCPEWSPQLLRSTCATYLTCAPGIYGGASLYRSAAQLGHSPEVARKHYLGLVSPPASATTLDAALGVEAVLAEIAEQVRGVAGQHQ